MRAARKQRDDLLGARIGEQLIQKRVEKGQIAPRQASAGDFLTATPYVVPAIADEQQETSVH
jgi:hypothetical protein